MPPAWILIIKPKQRHNPLHCRIGVDIPILSDAKSSTHTNVMGIKSAKSTIQFKYARTLWKIGSWQPGVPGSGNHVRGTLLGCQGPWPDANWSSLDSSNHFWSMNRWQIIINCYWSHRCLWFEDLSQNNRRFSGNPSVEEIMGGDCVIVVISHQHSSFMGEIGDNAESLLIGNQSREFARYGWYRWWDKRRWTRSGCI